MKIFGLEFKFNGFDIWHKGNFTPATVATSGKYSDLSGRPTSLPANGGTSSFLGNAVNITNYNTLNPAIITQGNITPIKAPNTANSPWNNTTSGFLIQSNDSDSFHILIFRSGGDGWAYRSYYQGTWSSWKIWSIFDGNYNSLSNKPDIYTKTEVDNKTSLNRIDITGQTVDINNFNLSSGSPNIQLYICKTMGGSANIANIPVTNTNFILNVELIRFNGSGDYITRQSFINTVDKGIYIRFCISGNWSSWSQIALKADIPTNLPANGGNSNTANKLATARTITITGDASGSASFDGSANSSINLTLALSGITAGTYKSVTVDGKGRITSGTNPTTLAGYGITDALLATAYTAADVLNKIKTVDGAGSTLDADMLDGMQGTNFAYSQNAGNADLNNITHSGMYRINNNLVNCPDSGLQYGQLLVIQGAGDTITQIATDYSSNLIYWRSGNVINNGTGTWSTWRKIWHDGNDGSGSGLDSDKLDGQEGAYYAPVASPTLTGTPKSPTPATTDSSTNIATTAFVKAQGYITAAGSGAKISVSSVEPSSTQPGDFWYKTS